AHGRGKWVRKIGASAWLFSARAPAVSSFPADTARPSWPLAGTKRWAFGRRLTIRPNRLVEPAIGSPAAVKHRSVVPRLSHHQRSQIDAREYVGAMCSLPDTMGSEQRHEAEVQHTIDRA